jgi:RNA recognition motif-containing protein
MSRLKAAATEDVAPMSSRKRKAISQDLEIDIDAPEPPSKKAARKAKRAKLVSETNTTNAEQGSGSGNHDGANEGVSTGRSPYGIWIGNLSFSTTKQELQSFMSGDEEHPIPEVEITRIHLPLSTTASGPRSQNKGFAYVDFSSPQAQQKALQLSEKLLMGRRVLIKSSRDFEGRPEKSESTGIGSKMAPSKRVFLGNLDFDVTKDDLESHFEVCGPIAKVQIATFEDSGKCKGYAWIDFEDIAAAAAAVRGWVESATANKASEQTNKPKRRVWVNKIRGRKLRAEFAEDKTTRYNKRFGKNMRNAMDEESGEQAPGLIETSSDTHALQPDVKKPSSFGKRNNRHRSGRYDEETVAKLTGAIAGAQGKKTTFE